MKLVLALSLAMCYLALVVDAKKEKRVPRCQAELEEAEASGNSGWVPECDKSGKYEKKQCNEELCWCVTARKGKPAFRKLKLPLGEDYTCKKKPSKCQRKRFDALLADPEDPKAPVCDAAGDFVVQSEVDLEDVLEPQVAVDPAVPEVVGPEVPEVIEPEPEPEEVLEEEDLNGEEVVEEEEALEEEEEEEKLDEEEIEDEEFDEEVDDVIADVCKSDLGVGDQMRPGDKLCSTNGLYVLLMQEDGNVVCVKKADNSVLWSTDLTGKLRLVLQGDGNLVLYDQENVARWASDSHGKAKHLVMQNDGNVVVYGEDGEALWARTWCPPKLWPGQTLTPGQKICSPNGEYRAILQTDGNFVIYNSQNGVVWATNKMGGGHRLVMQRDGNLVIYNSSNGVVWAANKQGEPRYAIMQNDANLVVYSTSSSAIWASKW